MMDDNYFLNKTILIISPQPWRNHFVSKHHYAIHLSQLGAKVFFLNPPSNHFESKDINSNLKIVDFKHSRGISKLPGKIASRLINRDLKQLEKKLRVKFDIIWSFELSRFFNLKAINDKIKILHIVDFNLLESKNLTSALDSYDIFFGTSNFILEKFHSSKPKHKINHGFNANLLLHPLVNKETDYDKLSIAYLGNLSIDYLDWELIYETCMTHPNIEFHFIGPMRKDHISDSGLYLEFQERTMLLPNSTFHAPVSSDNVRKELNKYDLLLICYKSDEYPEQLANPHKVLEYIGTGKPIVATYTDEYSNTDNLMEMAATRKEFPQLFDKVIQDLPTYSSKEKFDHKIEFAKENSYQNHLMRIGRYLMGL